ncbi:MAG TPA: DUF4058 family protein [Pirellulales bacterium]|nr:DUF4058 family protein [Pirellulales bacterium]
MPIHDWIRVDAGIFHAFHHDWITELARSLNRRLLPADYYALPEQVAAGFGPDVLTLQEDRDGPTDESVDLEKGGAGGVLLAAPRLRPVAETDLTFYRRKQNSIALRHVSGDRLVAMVEIVSAGNKAAQNPLRALVSKVAELLEQGIHLLVIDLHPPGKRDPQGIHNEIWQEVAGKEYVLPAGQPLTIAAYETANGVRAYVVHAAVGETLADMPLFLEPGKAVEVPLEASYNAAFADVPRRWRRVLEA